MLRFKRLSSLCLLAVLALAMPALAKPYRTTLDVTQKTKIGNLALVPGEYRLIANDTSATVMKGRKVLGEVKCHWIESAHKTPTDEIIYKGDRLIEVRPGGKTRVLEFQ